MSESTGQSENTQLLPGRPTSTVSIPFSWEPMFQEERVEESPLDTALTVAYRYKLLIGTILVLCVLAAGYRTYRMPKIYQAKVMVNVGKYIPPLDGPMADVLREETKTYNYVNNQVPILSSFTIASVVLKENPEIRRYFDPAVEVSDAPSEKLAAAGAGRDVEDIVADQLKRAGKENPVGNFPTAVLQQYLNSVSFNVLYNTTIINITAHATRPDMASTIANAHAAAFVALVRQQRLRAAQVNLEFLTNRMREVKTRFAEAEDKLNNYVKQNAIVTDDRVNSAGTTLSTMKMQDLLTTLNDVVIEKSKREAEARELKRATGAVTRANDTTYKQFVELARLEGEYEYFRRLRANPFYLSQLQREISVLRESLKQFHKQTVRDAEVKERVSQSAERLVRAEVDKMRQEETLRSKLLAEYNILKQQRDTAKDLFEQVSQRFEDAVVNAENDQKTAIILDPAVPPLMHIKPSMRTNLLMGALFGLFGGVVLAFILNYLDDSVHSMNELQQMTTVKVLGVIPKFSKAFKKDLAAATKSSVVSSPMPEQSAVIPPDASGDPGFDGHVGPELDLTGDIPPGFHPRAAHADGPTRATRVSHGTNGNGHPRPDQAIVITNQLDQLIGAASGEAEAFRTILATVRYSASSLTPPKSLLVTSGQKGEGKTTLAANLALASAEASKRTLLIDSDLRLPAVHSYFGLPRETPGLVDYLTGRADYSSLIVELGIKNLCVMTSGSRSSTPGILLQSSRMAEILELLSDEFDQIIVDSPPVLRVADALMLSPLVSGVILVARSGKTPRSVANSAISCLRQVRSNVIGTVLNDVSKSSSFNGIEYYFARDGYGYY